MKLKTSAYHIPVFIYRYGFVALTLPLQTIFLESADPFLFTYIYLSNLLILTTIVICACISYKQIKCAKSRIQLNFSKGTFLQTNTHLPHKKIHTISITQGPLQRRLNICRLTAACAATRQSIYTTTPESHKLLGNCTFQTIHRSSVFSTFLLCAGFYNAFTGALTLIPLLRKIATLANAHEYSAEFFTSAFAVYTISELPNVLFALSVIIILLWITGVMVTFLRYANLTFSLGDSSAKITRGLVTKRTTYVNKQNVSAVILRQNLLMILLDRYTGELRAACDKNENKVTFLCGAKKNTAQKVVQKTSFASNCTKKEIRPHPKSLWGYTYLPVSLIALVSATEIIADFYLVRGNTARLGLFIILWLAAWFFFRVCVWSKCFVKTSENSVCIGCYFGLTYCKAYIPKDKIRSTKITQSPFQRTKNTCTLRVFIKGSTKKSYFIKHIEKEKAAELTQELCG